MLFVGSGFCPLINFLEGLFEKPEPASHLLLELPSALAFGVMINFLGPYDRLCQNRILSSSPMLFPLLGALSLACGKGEDEGF